MPNIQTLERVFQQLGDLSPQLAVGLAMLIFNFVMRRLPWIPNNAILPLSLVWGMTLYCIFCPRPENVYNPKARLLLNGFFVGFFAWLLYDKIIRLLEAKWPWLHDKIAKDDPNLNKGLDGKNENDNTPKP